MIKTIDFVVEIDKYDPHRVNIESKICGGRSLIDRRSANNEKAIILESKKTLCRNAEQYLFGDILDKVRECLSLMPSCETQWGSMKLGDALMEIVDLAKLKIKD